MITVTYDSVRMYSTIITVTCVVYDRILPSSQLHMTVYACILLCSLLNVTVIIVYFTVIIVYFTVIIVYFTVIIVYFTVIRVYDPSVYTMCIHVFYYDPGFYDQRVKPWQVRQLLSLRIPVILQRTATCCYSLQHAATLARGR